jgi:hypothetical protein
MGQAVGLPTPEIVGVDAAHAFSLDAPQPLGSIHPERLPGAIPGMGIVHGWPLGNHQPQSVSSLDESSHPRPEHVSIPFAQRVHLGGFASPRVRIRHSIQSTRLEKLQRFQIALEFQARIIGSCPDSADGLDSGL